MDPHHAVVQLAAVAIPLPPHASGVVSALGDARLVHHADRRGMGMIFGDDLLAAVVQFLFIPLVGFHEAL